jgi:hypothetical protein
MPPTLTLDRTANGPNDAETAAGAGFTAGGKVALIAANSILGAGETIATLPVDGAGRFRESFTLPLDLDSGADHPNIITAVDESDPRVRATATLVGVAVQPVLTTISPDTLTPGGTIGALYGAGFGAGGPPALHRPDVLTVLLGDTPLVTTTTGPAGNFALFGAHIPAGTPAGDVLLTVRGQVRGIGQLDSASKVVAVSGPAALTVNPNPGRPGEQLAVSGAGFAPGEGVTLVVVAPVPATAGGTISITGTAIADATGHAGPIAVAVPATAPRTGQVTLTARGATSGRAAAEVVGLSATPSLLIDPPSGPPGTVLTISGFYFVPEQSVAVELASGATTAVADASGAITATLRVPAGTALGNQLVRARDSSGGLATATFAVTAPDRQAQ